MKELLAVISLLANGVVTEPQSGPYPASGWRPTGPAFELPQQQPAVYLPPVDPRNTYTPQTEYGPPNYSPYIPNVEYGIPIASANNPNVLGFPGTEPRASDNGLNVIGLGVPGGSGIAAVDSGAGFGFRPTSASVSPGAAFTPSVGVGAPGGPGIAAVSPDVASGTIPNAGSGIATVAPNGDTGISGGPGIAALQYERQQQYYREFERQMKLDALIPPNGFQRHESPADFASRATPATTEVNAPEETTIASTTEMSINESETKSPKKKERVTVELSAQKIQEYPGEFFLSSLAQLQLQPQFTPLQFGQLKDPLHLQPQSQKQVSGYDAQTHFAALPSIIAQQKLQLQKILVPAEQGAPELHQLKSYQQPQFQVEQLPVQPQAFYPEQNIEPGTQYQLQLQPQMQPQPQFQLQPLAQYVPQAVQFQPQPAPFQPQFAQFQPQPGSFQPAIQPQPDNKDVENIDQNSYQPQVFQQRFLVPQPKPGFVQSQLITYPEQDFSQIQSQFQQQNQFPSQFQVPSQGADALQSGLDINQQGNDIDEPKDQEEGRNEGTTATAVATAFGTRTKPRVVSKYGTPFSVPRVQADTARTTTESPAEDVTDEGPVVAHAVAIADGTRKKSGKLRRSRVRPIFTLDKSGHLVLAGQ